MKLALRILVGLLVAAVVVWLLFTIVFPWVDGQLLDDPTLAGLR